VAVLTPGDHDLDRDRVPVRIAGRKGHSSFGFFIFSLIFFPAALIVAYVVKPRAVTM
jgi:hypothetical protein